MVPQLCCDVLGGVAIEVCLDIYISAKLLHQNLGCLKVAVLYGVVQRAVATAVRGVNARAKILHQHAHNIAVIPLHSDVEGIVTVDAPGSNVGPVGVDEASDQSSVSFPARVEQCLVYGRTAPQGQIHAN